MRKVYAFLIAMVLFICCTTTSVATAAATGVPNIDTSKITGKIKSMYYADENRALILADKLYLYDIGSGSVLYDTKKPDFDEEVCRATKDGYAVMGWIFEGNATCILYDSKLNKTSEVRLDTLPGKEERMVSAQAMAVSHSGTNIAFATNKGLYLYDTKKKSKTKLIDLADTDAKKRFGLVIIEQIAFVKDDGIIAFKSQSFDVPAVVGKSSFDTYGSIRVDGSGLSVNRSNDYSVKEMTAYNSFVLWAEDFTVPSGRLMVLDMNSGKSTLIKTKTKKESGNVFGSDKGAYFATSSIDKGKVTVRVYDTKTGSVLLEKVVTSESRYAIREPQIHVFDKSKTCVVLLGNRQADVDTQCVVLGF